MPWVKGPEGRWEGGRIWRAKDGRLTYVVQRMIGGHTFEVSTRCTSHRAALAQLARFEADPEGYDPAGGTEEPIRLTAELARAFLRYSLEDRGNSREWVGKQKRYLAWWAKRLGGRDLRRVTLRDHIAPALEGVPGRKQRIEVVKALYGWLRKERHLLTAAQDPTYGALAVPQGRPEQWVTPKPIPAEHHAEAMKHLTSPFREMLTVLDETGWHVTELARFIRAGRIEDLPEGRADGARAVIVCPRRKSGETQRTAVTAAAAEAGGRLLARGTFSKIRFYRALRAACVAAGVTPFTPGRYRHSLATRAIEAGEDPAAVAAYLGHKSPATTRRFYATLAVVPIPRRSARSLAESSATKRSSSGVPSARRSFARHEITRTFPGT
jgi:integrase